jgi:hypothetical protein
MRLDIVIGTLPHLSGYRIPIGATMTIMNRNCRSGFITACHQFLIEAT